MNLMKMGNSPGSPIVQPVQIDQAFEKLPFRMFLFLKTTSQNSLRINDELKEDDGDPIFTKKGSTFKFNIQQPQTFSFSPFGGTDINNNL